MLTERSDKMKNNKLIKLRHKLGFNQQDMADLLGITPQAYSLKENGKRSFKQSEMGVIYRMFSKIDNSITLQDIFLF